MKKVLIIGYPFPLRQGGSPRLLGLAKYLPEFGWEPIILTAPLDTQPDGQPRIVETQTRDALGLWKKLLGLGNVEDLRGGIKQRFGVSSRESIIDYIITLAGEILTYPDGDRGWKPFAVKAGNKLIKQEDIQAIISTSAPLTTHFIARELKIRNKIPWLADFRDLWTQNHKYHYHALRKALDRRLELRTVSMADAVTTVSGPWTEKLRTLHERKTVYSITNGFDPENINEPPVKLTDKFTVTHTGTIHPEGQNPAILLLALHDLISENIIDRNDIDIRFYGRWIAWLDNKIEELGLTDIVRQYGDIPLQTALEKQRESQLLAHFKWEDSQENGAYSLKIFEYLGARRPIIVTGGFAGDVVDELLDECKTGISAITVEDIKKTLRAFYQEYKSKGSLEYRGEVSETNKYSHREMARKFAEIIDTLL
ncbi:glycosyltransferase [Chloroflexota bacterium]